MKNPNPRNPREDINFYHKDGLGSITMITGRNGNVVERYSYDVYGNPYQGRFRNMQKNNPYGFTGQRFEAETWMYSFAYRTYNPVSKRWMTPDPIRDGMNWYQYVRSDPVNLWDPLGLETIVFIPHSMGGIGHAAVMVDNPEEGSGVFYDPQGGYSYRHPESDRFTRPQGDIFCLEHDIIDGESYVKYYNEVRGVDQVDIYRFDTTPQEEQQIIDRISEQDAGFLQCSLSVSSVLEGIGPFEDLKPTYFPRRLGSQLREIKEQMEEDKMIEEGEC